MRGRPHQTSWSDPLRHTAACAPVSRRACTVPAVSAAQKGPGRMAAQAPPWKNLTLGQSSEEHTALPVIHPAGRPATSRYWPHTVLPADLLFSSTRGNRATDAARSCIPGPQPLPAAHLIVLLPEDLCTQGRLRPSRPYWPPLRRIDAQPPQPASARLRCSTRVHGPSAQARRQGADNRNEQALPGGRRGTHRREMAAELAERNASPNDSPRPTWTRHTARCDHRAVLVGST